MDIPLRKMALAGTRGVVKNRASMQILLNETKDLPRNERQRKARTGHDTGRYGEIAAGPDDPRATV
jgi:hypothetical protein